MKIRKAVVDDSPFIVEHLLLAMEEIVYEFIGVLSHDQAKRFLLHFIKEKNNQYSYENCWVVELDNEIVASVNIYEGSRLKELREPVIQYIKEHYKKKLIVEDEAEPGEYYIDSFGVTLGHQGRGLGSAVLKFLINEYVHKNNVTLGLLVDIENESAKNLYLKMGFRSVGNLVLAGKKMDHLQLNSKFLL
ncbi:MAG: GNAT family N-acetyltransferase [Bacteroidales bacterium]|nr:GNAT family N-acetyltransferase [Bacteroidales bacterium]